MSLNRRLFFGLTLPAKVQKEIFNWGTENFTTDVGHPIIAKNLHLTLAYLGEVSSQKEQAMRSLAARIDTADFNLTLDDSGHWAKSAIVWLGIKNAPIALIQLAGLLRSHAARNGCYQSMLPFHPHITLLRGAIRPLILPPSTPNWRVNCREFCLFHSIQINGRQQYKIVDSWPLKPADSQ